MQKRNIGFKKDTFQSFEIIKESESQRINLHDFIFKYISSTSYLTVSDYTTSFIDDLIHTPYLLGDLVFFTLDGVGFFELRRYS